MLFLPTIGLDRGLDHLQVQFEVERLSELSVVCLIPWFRLDSLALGANKAKHLALDKDIEIQIIEEPESEHFLNRSDQIYNQIHHQNILALAHHFQTKPTSFEELSFVVCFEGSNKIQYFKNENGCQC
ncbi:MAG: hypothetical protein FRX49_12389 [Trebouxia sp. A1-2]|nr:MAG: hypothetical protein FRX49_12389 [Trebouxia sp. A1-2]